MLALVTYFELNRTFHERQTQNYLVVFHQPREAKPPRAATLFFIQEPYIKKGTATTGGPGTCYSATESTLGLDKAGIFF